MNRTRQLHDLGQSLWLDNITRELLDNGTLRRYIDEFSVTGLTSNPTIFDQAIGNSRRLRRRHPRQGGAGQVRRSAVLRAGAGGPAPRRRPVPAGLRRHRRRRRLGVAGGLAAARRRHGRQHRGGGAHPRAGRPAEPLRQDSGHAGRAFRRSRNRSSPACRSTSRCCSRASSTRRGRGLPARHRAAHRRRPRSAGRLGRLALRQPLGQGGRATRCRRAAQPARHRDRRRAPTAPIASCWPRRAGASSPPPARGRSACSGPAPAPRIPKARTRCTSRRWRRRTPSTPCPRRRCSPSPSTARCAASMAERRRRCRSGAGALRARPASMSTRWPRSCSARAPRRSSSRGTSCWTRIATKSEALGSAGRREAS